MYGKRELSINNIRNRISGYDVFSYYCSTFKELNLMFRSELRADALPSCSIQYYQGKFFYKDFATGDSFDDVGYIRAKYSLSFYGALELINKDFNLGLMSKKVESVPTMAFFGLPDKNLNTEEFIKATTFIKVQVRKWDIEDAKYWKGKYDISSKQLSFFGVFPLKYFWINDKISNCSRNSYGYFLGKTGDREIWKIYQPLEDRGRKWFSNACKSNIQGYTRLPPTGDVLYITSSLKDVIVLRKLKLNSIAPASESTPIDIHTIEELKQRFKKLVIFYDNDEPGIRASNKHSKLYGADELSVPISKDVTDPSDFVEVFGYNELLKIIKDGTCED